MHSFICLLVTREANIEPYAVSIIMRVYAMFAHRGANSRSAAL